MARCVEGIRRALVLGLVLIAETAIEYAPSVGPFTASLIGYPTCLNDWYWVVIDRASAYMKLLVPTWNGWSLV